MMTAYLVIGGLLFAVLAVAAIFVRWLFGGGGGRPRL